MGADLKDLQIISEVLAGNRNAYAQLVRRYEVLIRGYCLKTFADLAQAEDAAQEIFIKAYQSLSRFRGDSAFSTWLYRIAVNHCTDILRKTARAKTESWDALVEREGERAESLAAALLEADQSAERSELLAKILDSLSEKSRAIIVLREIQGLSYEELAGALSCSLDAIKGRLKRARQEIEVKLSTLFPNTKRPMNEG